MSNRIIPLAIVLCASSMAWAQSEGPGGSWRTHTDAAGFTVTLPAAWRATADAQSGRIALRGPAGDAIDVWPVFVPGLADVSAAFSARVFTHLVQQACPADQWSAPRSVATAALQMQGRRAGHALVLAAYAWMPTPRGTAGFLYCVSAPQAMTPSSEAAYSRILASLRLSGKPARPSTTEAIRYVSWVDPVEQAFSLEVPAGWSVQGGSRRFTAIEIRQAVELVSPDQSIIVRVGDLEVPFFEEPAPPAMGVYFPEGAAKPCLQGSQCLVLRYLPGAHFAVWLAQQRASGWCEGFAITEQRDRPDAAAIYLPQAAAAAQYGVVQRTDVGEATFRCERNDRLVQGYAYARTIYTGGSAAPSGSWLATDLVLYVATPDRIGTAAAVAQHAFASVRMNPQWEAMQRRTRQASSDIAAQSRRDIADIIGAAYASRSAAQAHSAEQHAQAIRGLENVVDPATGRTLQVESGSGYYWVDPAGTIVGTDSPSRPAVDFSELVRVP